MVLLSELSLIERLKYERYESDVESYYGGTDTDSEDDEPDLPLDKLNLQPKVQKKLIVLSVGGLLVHRVHAKDKASIRGMKPDFVSHRFSVFKRPFCTEFLMFCFQRFHVGIWSSARDRNIDRILDDIAGDKRRKLLFEWDQYNCTERIDIRNKPLFLKELKDLWDILECSYPQRYSASNTLLIGDKPQTCLLNQPNTAIFPHPYDKHDEQDTFLGPDGTLWRFLDGLATAEDVPSYVKDHRIGLPEIAPSHPDWDYYARIVDQLSKKEECGESSSK